MNKGFTLIEVICAVTILSIIMVMFSSLVTNSLTLSSNAQNIDNTSSISKSFIEQDRVNDGSIVGEERTLTFTFGTENIEGSGEIYNTGGDVSYSVLVADSSEFNLTGWASGWNVAGTNPVVNTPTTSPTTGPSTSPKISTSISASPTPLNNVCDIANGYTIYIYVSGYFKYEEFHENPSGKS